MGASTWTHTLLVGSGGFAGAVLRHGLNELAARYLPATFPCATFAINVTGCFGIGLLGALATTSTIGTGARLFWITGVLGGYTTFSTFGYETLTLVRDGQWGAAAFNAFGQLVLGLLAVWAGLSVAREL